MHEFRILSPTAILGYGFPESSFLEGLSRKPNLIAVDGGSTDPGPYYLGAGVSFTERGAVKRDLEQILVAGLELGIPVVVGTAGGSGGDPHLAWMSDIVWEIAGERGLSFTMALISAEIHREYLIGQVRAGHVSPMIKGWELDEKKVANASRIVAQMGMYPIMRAMEQGAQVILAGRAYDPAVFAAPAVRRGFAPGPAIHLGKILECGAIAATPGSGSDCLLGTLYEDGFLVEPLNPARKCTVTSVAAHTLYEKSNPIRLPGPSGVLDLSECSFTQHNDKAVMVRGSKFIPAEEYSVKLEGVEWVGCRAICIAGCRDPIMIRRIDEIIKGVRDRVTDNFNRQGYKYYLNFNLYGKNGVMGELEPLNEIKSHELGIIIETVAETQEVAHTICSFARSTMLHIGYEDRVATAGNLAFPYSPSDFEAGDVYRFSIYHLLKVSDPCELFPIEMVEVNGALQSE